jgi:hypothetical protein
MINNLFIDSGAHSLYNINARNKNYNFYETDDFWKYVDDYCQFILLNKKNISVYVSVDVIFQPELSWKVQRYMEDNYKIKPLPVFHFPILHHLKDFSLDGNFNNSQIKWLKKYMDTCEYIGLGGLGQQVTKKQFIIYADRLFKLLCTPKGTAKWKIHGFAMTSFDLMKRYPWYSVDSTSYRLQAAYGTVLFPKIKNNEYLFDISPTGLKVTPRILSKNKTTTSVKHINNFLEINPTEREKLKNYLNWIRPGTKLGKTKYEIKNLNYELKKDERWFKKFKKENKGMVELIIEEGIENNSYIREELNLRLFQKVSETLRKQEIKNNQFEIYFAVATNAFLKIAQKNNANCLISYYFLKDKNFSEEALKSINISMPFIKNKFTKINY